MRKQPTTLIWLPYGIHDCGDALFLKFTLACDVFWNMKFRQSAKLNDLGYKRWNLRK